MFPAEIQLSVEQFLLAWIEWRHEVIRSTNDDVDAPERVPAPKRGWVLGMGRDSRLVGDEA